jgi:hypothetical protein
VEEYELWKVPVRANVDGKVMEIQVYEALVCPGKLRLPSQLVAPFDGTFLFQVWHTPAVGMLTVWFSWDNAGPDGVPTLILSVGMPAFIPYPPPVLDPKEIHVVCSAERYINDTGTEWAEVQQCDGVRRGQVVATLGSGLANLSLRMTMWPTSYGPEDLARYISQVFR